MIKYFTGLVAGLIFLGVLSTVYALPLVNSGFDDPINGLTGRSWGVFQSINGWTTGVGPGIEIQRSTIVPAHSGSQYVELDSHGGTDTNSTMFQEVELLAGDYTLSWMYHARTNTSNDNGIKAGVSFAGDSTIGSSFWTNSISSTYNAQRPDIWTQVDWTFTIASDDKYKLWFGADGLDNTLGGFIDSVSLAPAPVPEPATMFLFGTGLVGLVGVARRKKK